MVMVMVTLLIAVIPIPMWSGVQHLGPWGQGAKLLGPKVQNDLALLLVVVLAENKGTYCIGIMSGLYSLIPFSRNHYVCR